MSAVKVNWDSGYIAALQSIPDDAMLYTMIEAVDCERAVDH